MKQKSIEYVRILNEQYQSYGFPLYQWSSFSTTTWTPLEKPLSEYHVALLSSSGISRKDQIPFPALARSDLSYREIHKDTRATDLVISV